ncbi:hypothetical protein [Polaromonas sp.]|jgi:hypothetical protein|uniref:hypothetical protein n=1 Tax=Polaromonas sp. TaxID=1869339 RepID=UPI0037C75A0D
MAPRNRARLDAAQAMPAGCGLAWTTLLAQRKNRPRWPLELIHLNAGQPGLSYSDKKGCEPLPANDTEKTMVSSKTTPNNVTAAANMAVLKHLAGKT